MFGRSFAVDSVFCWDFGLGFRVRGCGAHVDGRYVLIAVLCDGRSLTSFADLSPSAAPPLFRLSDPLPFPSSFVLSKTITTTLPSPVANDACPSTIQAEPSHSTRLCIGFSNRTTPQLQQGNRFDVQGRRRGDLSCRTDVFALGKMPAPSPFRLSFPPPFPQVSPSRIPLPRRSEVSPTTPVHHPLRMNPYLQEDFGLCSSTEQPPSFNKEIASIFRTDHETMSLVGWTRSCWDKIALSRVPSLFPFARATPAAAPTH
ncbi:hypothetical protein NLJ89_g12108 [Agrocybe chaxingu]|uniref:Uncharacterized protein n=1 Tax=Agrocybe chaxingu TaxID=84603 RepID=A0A9W8JMH5_9AGAR|nr:hypothetical protein NLJ89_g12108 [Agrocybe chaxingu]